MIHLKSQEEIKIMRDCGARLHAAVSELLPLIKPEMTTLDVEAEAVRCIKKNGAELSFTRVSGYNWATCLPINEQVVHTPPSKRVIKSGDVLTVDIGAYYQGFHTDYATTFTVGGKQEEKTAMFLQAGKKALELGISQAKLGNRIGHISSVIEKEIYDNGYFILKDLTGHGIGHELHEDPYVPGFLNAPVEKTLELKSGLVIAIEVIYSMGSEEIAYEKDVPWSITSADKSLTACFEETVAIDGKNTYILT